MILTPSLISASRNTTFHTVQKPQNRHWGPWSYMGVVFYFRPYKGGTCIKVILWSKVLYSPFQMTIKCYLGHLKNVLNPAESHFKLCPEQQQFRVLNIDITHVCRWQCWSHLFETSISESSTSGSKKPNLILAL